MSQKLDFVQTLIQYRKDASKIKELLAFFDSLKDETLKTQSELDVTHMTLESKERSLKKYKEESDRLKKGAFEAYKLLKLYAGEAVASAFLKKYG